MPLIALWSSSPDVIGQLAIEQIVANAGSGDLRDNSDCAQELREYLSQVSSEKLKEYIERCLISNFSKSGNVLQDLVNELGRRLDYKVTNGRYQGTVNQIGYDGIWVSPEGQTVVVEVKTTDAYRISFDTIAGYRYKLLKAGQIATPSSSLIIVGREDTGELEAQISGSRHAWDMRLISADALIKLVQLKESAEGAETGVKIRSLLVPREYTRLDEMVDVMFTAAKDVESAANAVDADDLAAEPDAEVGHGVETTKGKSRPTDRHAQQRKRNVIAAALSRREGMPLIRKSAAVYWSADHSLRAGLVVSKRYTDKGDSHYWYGYRKQWYEFLHEAKKGYLVLGCMDKDEAFTIPISVLDPLLDKLYTTADESEIYHWHLQLTESASGEVSLIVPKEEAKPLSGYQLKLDG